MAPGLTLVPFGLPLTKLKYLMLVEMKVNSSSKLEISLKLSTTIRLVMFTTTGTILTTQRLQMMELLEHIVSLLPQLKSFTYWETYMISDCIPLTASILIPQELLLFTKDQPSFPQSLSLTSSDLDIFISHLLLLVPTLFNSKLAGNQLTLRTTLSVSMLPNL